MWQEFLWQKFCLGVLHGICFQLKPRGLTLAPDAEDDSKVVQHHAFANHLESKVVHTTALTDSQVRPNFARQH